MLNPAPGESTIPGLSLLDEIRQVAAEAAHKALLDRQEGSRRHHRWDAQALVAVVLAIICGIIWCVRLEGRVNASDQRAGTIEAQLAQDREAVSKAQDPVIRRLDRLEDKVDQLLGAGRRK